MRNLFTFLSILLQVGLFVQDLADRFDVSTGAVSQIFNTWIVFLEGELDLLNPCPIMEQFKPFLPPKFQKFPNCRFIIDCTELFIERASSLLPQQLTFSNYKHHNTVKFLVLLHLLEFLTMWVKHGRAVLLIVILWSLTLFLIKFYQMIWLKLTKGSPLEIY